MSAAAVWQRWAAIHVSSESDCLKDVPWEPENLQFYLQAVQVEREAGLSKSPCKLSNC